MPTSHIGLLAVRVSSVTKSKKVDTGIYVV